MTSHGSVRAGVDRRGGLRRREMSMDSSDAAVFHLISVFDRVEVGFSKNRTAPGGPSRAVGSFGKR